MSFVSFDFVVFYVLVTILYFVVPHRYRWMLLLAASYYFYSYWRLDYLPLIVVSTLANYALAIGLERAQGCQRCRLWLLIGVIGVNFGTLFAFKYFNFFAESVGVTLGYFGVSSSVPLLDVLLPVGISFYTFQGVSYVIDVYRGVLPAERHLGIFATYLAFFPQLVAGPIERAGAILPQFFEKHAFDYARAVSGLQLVLWGAFKKIVIADRLAAYVNRVYGNVELFQGVHLIVATLFFAIQIYCDFSAYSDIAVGTARLLGFDLMENFRAPYFSRSVREFWRRWHISLSTWFRDYLYVPLGGNRVPVPRYLVNLFIVFTVSGLWHGASWTFVIWGMLHGFYIIIEELLDRFVFRKPEQRASPLRSFTGGMITFVLVTFAWIFFRAESLTDAVYVITHLFSINPRAVISTPFNLIAPFGNHGVEFAMAILSITVLFVHDWVARRTHCDTALARLPQPWRWAAYYVMVFLIIYSLSTTKPAFLYFQF